MKKIDKTIQRIEAELKLAKIKLSELLENERLNETTRYETNLIYVQDGIIEGLRTSLSVLKADKHTKETKDITKSEIESMMINQGLTITNMIDVVVDLNALIGVGLIRLGDDLKQYCYDKIDGGK